MILIIALLALLLYGAARIIRKKYFQEQETQTATETPPNIEIQRLRYKMYNCECERKALRQRMENLQELYKIESAEIEAADRAGDDKRKAAALRRIMTLDNQIATVEKKDRKLRQDWTIAKSKLSA